MWRTIIRVGTVRILHFLYRYGVSPLIHLLVGPSAGCRFQPSCGDYVAECITKLGWIQGLKWGLRRLSRCHPWGGSGSDDVPDLKRVNEL